MPTRQIRTSWGKNDVVANEFCPSGKDYGMVLSNKLVATKAFDEIG